jgi:hypothetical protein
MPQRWSLLGSCPLVRREAVIWKELWWGLGEREACQLNHSIDWLNLLVPMLSGQLFHFQVEWEAKLVLRMGKCADNKDEVQVDVTEYALLFGMWFMQQISGFGNTNCDLKSCQSNSSSIVAPALDIILWIGPNNVGPGTQTNIYISK